MEDIVHGKDTDPTPRGCVKIGTSSFYISLIAVMSCFLWLMAVFLFFDRVTPKCILRGV